MVLGAHLGVEGIPARLGEEGLVEWRRANALLDRMPLLKDAASKDEL
jgi:hypothetical protein